MEQAGGGFKLSSLPFLFGRFIPYFLKEMAETQPDE